MGRLHGSAASQGPDNQLQGTEGEGGSGGSTGSQIRGVRGFRAGFRDKGYHSYRNGVQHPSSQISTETSYFRNPHSTLFSQSRMCLGIAESIKPAQETTTLYSWLDQANTIRKLKADGVSKFSVLDKMQPDRSLETQIINKCSASLFSLRN